MSSFLGVDATDAKEPVALGAQRHDEDNVVGCLISVIRYGSGDTEAKAARDRANFLMAEVDDEIRTNSPKVGDQTLNMRVTNREYESFPTKDQENAPVRVARILFDVVYKARTSP